MPGKKMNSAPTASSKSPEKKKKPVGKKVVEEVNLDTETSEKDYIKNYKSIETSKKRTEAMGYKTEKNPAYFVGQPTPAEKATEPKAPASPPTPIDDPHDPITQKDTPAWAGTTPPKPEMPGVDDPHDSIAPGDIHKWTGEKPPTDEKVPSVEDQMKEHGIFDTEEKAEKQESKKGPAKAKFEYAPWQEAAIKDAKERYERLIKIGASYPTIERDAALLRDELITAAQAGNNNKVASYLRSIDLYEDRVKNFNKEQAAKKEKNINTGAAAIEKALEPELNNNKTPEAAPKGVTPPVDETEALLGKLAAQNKPKKPEPTAAAPRTPEQIEAELKASLVSTRETLANAAKMRDEERKKNKNKSWPTRAWEAWSKRASNAKELDDYKLAEHAYQLSKEAMANHKRGADVYTGNEAVFKFVEDEAKEYTTLRSASPEKRNGVMRALERYNSMSKPAKWALSITLSTVAFTSAIAATGGFASVAAAFSFAGGKALRTAGGIAVSAAAAEGVGKLRDNKINKKQAIEREALVKNVTNENLAQSIVRREAMIAERAKYNKRTGIYKAATAIAAGGGLGAASTYFDSLHAIQGAVSNDVAPWNSEGYMPTAPNLSVPAGTVESANLDPLVHSYDDPMHTPPYPIPEQGFEDHEPLGPSDNYADNPPVEVGQAASAPAAPAPSDNYADNPAVEKGTPAPKATDPSASVTKSPAINPETTVQVKSGDNLWNLNKGMLMQNKEFASLSLGKQEAVLVLLQEQYENLEKLKPGELQGRGFVNGDLNVIQKGATVRLFDLASPKANIHSLIEQANGGKGAAALSTPGASASAEAPQAETPLPRPRPTLVVNNEASSPDTPTTTASARTTVENVGGVRGAESVALPLNPDTIKGAWPLLAKGINVAPGYEGSMYRSAQISTTGISLEQYKLLNWEIATAHDKFNINLDGKSVGKVLEELAQKRAASGVKLAA